MSSNDPHYYNGAFAMATTLAVKELPRDPRYAKQILERTLKEYLPHATPEVQRMLREERGK